MDLNLYLGCNTMLKTIIIIFTQKDNLFYYIQGSAPETVLQTATANQMFQH